MCQFMRPSPAPKCEYKYECECALRPSIVVFISSAMNTKKRENAVKSVNIIMQFAFIYNIIS